MAGSGIYVAKESAHIHIGEDEEYTIIAGETRVRGDHVTVKKHPELFEPIDGTLAFGVERATAGPGEKRRAPAKATS